MSLHHTLKYKWGGGCLYDSKLLLNSKYIYPQELLEILNSVNPSIQFTMEISDNNLPFLDTLLNK